MIIIIYIIIGVMIITIFFIFTARIIQGCILVIFSWRTIIKVAQDAASLPKSLLFFTSRVCVQLSSVLLKLLIVLHQQMIVRI